MAARVKAVVGEALVAKVARQVVAVRTQILGEARSASVEDKAPEVEVAFEVAGERMGEKGEECQCVCACVMRMVARKLREIASYAPWL